MEKEHNVSSQEPEEYIRTQMTRYPVPDSLQPEQIEKRIADVRVEGKGRFRSKHRYLYAGAAAACAVLMIGVTVVRGGFLGSVPSKNGDSGNAYVSSEGSESNVVAGEHTTYARLYDTLQKEYREISLSANYAVNGRAEDMALEDSAGIAGTAKSSAGRAETASAGYTDTDIQVDGVMESDRIKTDGSFLYVLHVPDYGEEETDKLRVTIYDAASADALSAKEVKAERISEIHMDEELDGYIGSSWNYWDMYLSGDKLFLIGSVYTEDEAKSDETGKDGIGSDETGKDGTGSEEAGEDDIEISAANVAVADVGYFHRLDTVTLSFDISNPAHPVRISRLVQSGSKAMTRLSDGHLYVFSDYEPWQEIYRLEEKGTDHGIGFSEEDIDQYVPSADGEVLPQERLYLPKDTTAREYLVMTSVDVEKPDEFSDRAATLGWSNTFYMGTEYIYMISADYDKDGNENSLIDKYHYVQGHFDYLAHAKVKGRIEDSYCMHEYQEHFVYVYTEETYEKEEYSKSNGLAVMDAKLKPVAGITDLGKDETIYASYFMENMAYFVTYRNTDPVFAVDLADIEHPKLKSELKLPGFSSYLHSFGTDEKGNTLLAGLGMGNQEATLESEDVTDDTVKLSLFSVDKEGQVREEQTVWEVQNTWLNTDDRHEILVDEQNGLIGYSMQVDEWEQDDGGELTYWREYVLYRYQDGSFVKLLDQRYDCGAGREPELRGVRIGDVFYIIDTAGTSKSLKGYVLGL